MLLAIVQRRRVDNDDKGQKRQGSSRRGAGGVWACGGSRHRHGVVVVQGLRLLLPPGRPQGTSVRRPSIPLAARFPTSMSLPNLIGFDPFSAPLFFSCSEAAGSGARRGHLLTHGAPWEADAAEAPNPTGPPRLDQGKAPTASTEFVVNCEFWVTQSGPGIELVCPCPVLTGEVGGKQEGAAEAHLRPVRCGRDGRGGVEGLGERQRAVAARRGWPVQDRWVEPGERVGGEGGCACAGGEPVGRRDARALQLRRQRTVHRFAACEAAVG